MYISQRLLIRHASLLGQQIKERHSNFSKKRNFTSEIWCNLYKEEEEPVHHLLLFSHGFSAYRVFFILDSIGPDLKHFDGMEKKAKEKVD